MRRLTDDPSADLMNFAANTKWSTFQAALRGQNLPADTTVLATLETGRASIEEKQRESEPALDLSMTPGANVTQKLVNYLSAQDPAFAKLGMESKIVAARQVRLTRRIVTGYSL